MPRLAVNPAVRLDEPHDAPPIEIAGPRLE
jgi:hypothetical protein